MFEIIIKRKKNAAFGGVLICMVFVSLSKEH